MKEKIYTGFLFLPSMKKAMDELPDKDAKELAMAIIEYGSTGIYISDNYVINAVMQGIKPTIDSSISKYANNCEDGNHGGAKPKYDTEKIITLYLAGMTREGIAAEMGCHPNTVGKRIRDYTRDHPEIDTTTTNNDTTIQQEYNNNQDKDKANDNDKDKDEDSQIPIEKEPDTLVSLLSDLCDFCNVKKINSIVAKKTTKTITADLLRACLKTNYDEIYDIIRDKKADSGFKYDSDSVSYAIGILVKKIENGWKPSTSTGQKSYEVLQLENWACKTYHIKCGDNSPLWAWLTNIKAGSKNWLNWIEQDKYSNHRILIGLNAVDEMQALYDYHMHPINEIVNETIESDLPF